jgi:hypothetical protein
VGTQTQTKVSNSLSGGGTSGQVITVSSDTAVTDQATLSGANVAGAGGTVTYNVDSLSPSKWGWNTVASGGTVTVTNGVVPPSDAVTLGPGVYAWNASYSGDTLNAPSKNERESGIEIVLPPGSNCPTGVGWLSVRCFSDSHHGDQGNGGGNNGNGGQNDNGGGNNGNGGQNDNHGGTSYGNGGNSYGNGGGNSYGNGGGNSYGNGGNSDGNGGGNIHYRNSGSGWSGH